MNTFAALWPPPAVTEELERALVRLGGQPAGGLRWTEPAAWHLTLAFYGKPDDTTVVRLRERLAMTARRHAGFRLRLRGGGSFGHRVLWAGVAGDLTALAGLAAATTDAGRQLGAAPADGEEAHPYHPHLTLAWARSGASAQPWAERLLGFEGVDWPVSQLVLARSTGQPPGSGEPRYRVDTAWPLAG